MDLGLVGARALLGGASSGLGAASHARSSTRARGLRSCRARPTGSRPRWMASALRPRRPRRPGHARTVRPSAVATAVERLGGLDLLLVNSGGPPLGRVRGPRRADLGEGDRRDAAEHAPADPRRAAAPPGQRPTGDPRDPVVLGARADPRADHLEPAASRARRARQVAVLGDRPDPHQRLTPGRVSTDRIEQMDAADRGAGPGTSEDVIQPRTSPASRSGATASRPRWAAWRRSCCRRPRSYVTGAIVPVDGGMVKALP